MRTIQTRNIWKPAVYWLSMALLIVLCAFAAYAYSVQHSKRVEKERAALLFASDLLALRDSREAKDGNDAVYLALLESRIPQLSRRTDTEHLPSVLRSETLFLLARETEQALRAGLFNAEFLADLLTRFLIDSPVKQESDEQQLSRSFGERDAASAARNLLGLRFLQNADSHEQKTAFCRNACAFFDRTGRNLRAYTVFSRVGDVQNDDGICLSRAIRFVRHEQGIRFLELDRSWLQEGIRYFLLSSREERILVGVRADTAGVCFFLRSPKNTGNVLQ